VKRFINVPNNLSESLSYQKLYRHDMLRKYEEPQSPLVIDDVLATQALVMRLHGEQSRSAKSRNGRHMFSSLNNIATEPFELYDGSLEEYMACRVAKVDYGQWQMRIRFRQNELALEEKDRSYIDDYSFAWNRRGNLQAWYENFRVHAGATGTVSEVRDVHPLDTYELAALHERLNVHTEMASRALRLARVA